MRNIIILSVEELEAIKEQIDDLIDEARDGAQRGQDPKFTCQRLMGELQLFKSKFE